MKRTKSEAYSLSVITKNILESEFIVFSKKTIAELTNTQSERVLFKLIQNLLQGKILIKLERDKYLKNSPNHSSFNLANRLYSPSYLSLETALNYYGMLAQFPYEISSITTKKAISKNIEGVIYSYAHLKPELYFGYQKKDGVLIAEPEKALLDLIYLSTKGLKVLNLDEYEYRIVNKAKLKEYSSKYPQTRQTKKMISLVESVLQLC